MRVFTRVVSWLTVDGLRLLRPGVISNAGRRHGLRAAPVNQTCWNTKGKRRGGRKNRPIGGARFRDAVSLSMAPVILRHDRGQRRAGRSLARSRPICARRGRQIRGRGARADKPHRRRATAPTRNGEVVPPPGWKEAYRDWTGAGWNALPPAEFGGQGLPAMIDMRVQMWNGANMAFGLNPSLTQAGVEAVTNTAPRS